MVERWAHQNDSILKAPCGSIMENVEVSENGEDGQAIGQSE